MLPLTVSSEDFSYKSLTDPNPNHRSQELQIEEDAKNLRGRIGDMVPTTFAVSFVVSFQNRWTSFEEPNRMMNRFPDDFQLLIHNIFHTTTERQRQIDKEHSPNYWHPNDYMQHKLIGPVVLQVYESEVLQPGIYGAVPKVTHWEAPEFILPDRLFEALKESTRNGEKVWRSTDILRWLQPGAHGNVHQLPPSGTPDNTQTTHGGRERPFCRDLRRHKARLVGTAPGRRPGPAQVTGGPQAPGQGPTVALTPTLLDSP